MGTDAKVAAEKKVLLPTFGFPVKPRIGVIGLHLPLKV
jgi:hypothetical protein